MLIENALTVAAQILFSITLLQDDLQVCDVRHSLHPEALALRAL